MGLEILHKIQRQRLKQCLGESFRKKMWRNVFSDIISLILSQQFYIYSPGHVFPEIISFPVQLPLKLLRKKESLASALFQFYSNSCSNLVQQYFENAINLINISQCTTKRGAFVFYSYLLRFEASNLQKNAFCSVLLYCCEKYIHEHKFLTSQIYLRRDM